MQIVILIVETRKILSTGDRKTSGTVDHVIAGCMGD
jgi:hypothetical protein